MALEIKDPTILDRVAAFVDEKWREKKTERARREFVWIDCETAYDVKLMGKTWDDLDPYRSRRATPYLWQAVEDVNAAIFQGTLPNDNFFRASGRQPGARVGASLNAALLKYELYEQQFEEKWDVFTKQALCFGNAVWGVSWETRRVRVPDYSQARQRKASLMNFAQMLGLPTDGETLELIEGKIQETSNVLPYKDVIQYDGPVFGTMPIYNYVQDHAPSDALCPLRIVKFIKDPTWLLNQAKPNPQTGYVLYENLDKVDPATIRPKLPLDASRREMDVKRGFSEKPIKDAIEIYEAWGNIVVPNPSGKDTVLENYVCTVANGVVIRLEPNPQPSGRSRWNLFRLFPHPTDPVYGCGVMEVVLGIQSVIDVRVNQTIDANELTIDPMLHLNNVSGVFRPAEFIAGPGQIVETGDGDELGALTMPNNTGVGMAEIQFFLGMLNEATGASRSQSNGGQPISASESQFLGGQRENRMGKTIRHFQRSALIPALHEMLTQNQALMTEERWIRVIGDSTTGVLHDAQGNPIDEDELLDKAEQIIGTVSMGLGMGDPNLLAQFPIIAQQMTQLLSGGSRALTEHLMISPDDLAGDFDILIEAANAANQGPRAIANKIQLLQVQSQDPEGAAILKKQNLFRSMWEDAGTPDAYRYVKSRREMLLDQWNGITADLASLGIATAPGGPGSLGPAEAPAGPGMGGVQDLNGASGMAKPQQTGPGRPEQLSGPTVPH